MVDTTFTDSYIPTDTILETMIGNDPRAPAISLKALAADSQMWYCQEATRRIDALPLRGVRYEFDQDQEFPRLIDGVGVGDPGSYYAVVPEIPTLVKWACLEEAIAILEQGTGGRRALQDQGVVSFSIGGKLSETFVPGAGASGLQSSAAKRYMRRFLGVETR
jgi:hypothetical protein